MGSVKKKLVCIICLKRFQSEKREVPFASQQKEPNGKGTTLENEKEEPSSLKDVGKEETVLEESGNSNLYKRFLLFVNQYFKLRTFTDRFIQCAKEAKSGGDDERSTRLETFCESCGELVRDICNLYKELRTAQLFLVWKLGQMGELIKKSKIPMSYKLAKGLKASIAEQMNLDAVRPVGLFRQALQVKCITAAKKCLPDVTVHKGLFPDQWKFTYSATKQVLMRLIIVFSLASSQLHTKREPIKAKIEKTEVDDSKTYTTNKRACPKSKKRVRFSLSAPNSHLNHNKSDKNEHGNVKLEASGENEEYLAFDATDPDHDDDFRNDLDSDWSQGAASPITAGSDDDNDAILKKDKTLSKRKLNLRGRRILVQAQEDEDEGDSTSSSSSQETDEEEENYSKKRGRRRRQRSLSKSGKKAELKCPKCSDVFVDPRGLSRHLHFIHRTHIHYSCKKCGMRFKKRAELQLHHKNVHVTYSSKGTPYRGRTPVQCACPKCNQLFSNKAEMLRHKRTAHRIIWKKLECPYCFRTVVSEERYKIHVERHKNNTVRDVNLWYCEVCSKHFYKEESLKGHMKDVHNDKYSCAVCNEMLDTGKSLRDHLISHETDDEKPFLCQICFRSFTTQQFYDIHRKLAHMDKRRFVCDFEKCNDIFDTIPEMNKHLESHLDDAKPELKIFNCKTCEMGFLKEYSLILHELLHTPHSGKGTGYDCPKCDKNVRYKETLVTHYNMMHGEKIKPFKCEICQKYFSNPIWFRTHVRLHEERLLEGKFICDICGVRCVDSIALSAHRRGHDPNKKGRDCGVLLEDRPKEDKPKKGKRLNLFWRRTEIDMRLDPASPPPPDKASKKMDRKKRGRPRVRPMTKQDLEREKELQERFTKLSCDVENCGNIFESAYLLRKHLENEHEAFKSETEKNIQCYHCHKRFCYQQSQEIHVRAEHKKKIYGKFKCDLENCQEPAFLSAEELNRHLETHLEVNPEPPEPEECTTSFKEISFCGKCDWGFLRPEIRDLHQLGHIPPQEQDGRYPCPGCKGTYAPLSILRYHFNKVHGLHLRPNKCDECDKAYFSKDALNTHKKLHERRRHLDPDEKLMCVQCGWICKDEFLLEKHMKEHNPDNHVKCEKPGCGKSFSNRKNLWNHCQKDHRSRDWVCDLCGSAFHQQYHLKYHMRVHEEPKVPCDVCGQKFKRQTCMENHKKNKHNPDRVQSVCSLCGKAYFSADGLRYHFDSAHKPESDWHLGCPKCPRRFYRKMFLDLHLKKCDGSEDVKTEGNNGDNVDGGRSRKRGPPRLAGRKRKINESDEEDEEEMTDKSTTEDEDDDKKHSITTFQGTQQQQNEFQDLISTPLQQQPTTSQSQHFPEGLQSWTGSVPTAIPLEPGLLQHRYHHQAGANFPQMQFHQHTFSPFIQLEPPPRPQ